MQVHRFICAELIKLVHQISLILPKIEAARPGCSSGVQALCHLSCVNDKAKSCLLSCCDSSKLYLVCAFFLTISVYIWSITVDDPYCIICLGIPWRCAGIAMWQMEELDGTKLDGNPKHGSCITECRGLSLLDRILINTNFSVIMKFVSFSVVSGVNEDSVCRYLMYSML